MTPVSFGAHALAPALKTYLSRYPEVQVDLIVSDKIADVVESGVDVVVRVGLLADSTMISRTLGPYRSILCASPAYLDERGYPLRPEDLKDHSCLGFANPTAAARWRLSGPGGESLIPVAITLSANNGETLRQAALSGLGLIMQPEILVAPDLLAGRLTRILDLYEADVRPVHVMWHPDRALTPKIRTFVDFMVENFGESLVKAHSPCLLS
jgi:DNA-binding transcriptional LysR family regulator